MSAALRAGAPSMLPSRANRNAPAIVALEKAGATNARLRDAAIAQLASGQPDAAVSTLQQAVMAIPGDADAAALLTDARLAATGKLRDELDRATAAGDLLATERAARALAALLRGDPESGDLLSLADRSAPVALAEDSALWLVAPDGGDRRMLTDNVPVARPVWNPERTRLAFVSSDFASDTLPATLFVIDADGRNLRAIYRMAHPNAIPSWSPDGSRIALTSVENWSLAAQTGQLAIAAVPLDGGPIEGVAANLDAHATTPAWSPDGRSIAFIARPYQTDPLTSALAGPATVMQWSVDGSLRDLSGDALPTANRLLWSRDGRSLVVLTRDSAAAGTTSAAMSSIAAIDIASGRIDVLDDAIPTSSSGWGPAASTTGDLLAWVAGADTVVIRHPDGSRQAIDTNRLLSGALTWSPGGRQVLAIAAEPARPSALITVASDPILEDAPLRYDLEWPTGTPQWSPILDPAGGDGTLETNRPPGTGLDS